MHLRFGLWLILLLTLLFMAPGVSAQTVNMTVDATHTGQPFNRNMLGIGFGNWEFGWDKPMLGNPVYNNLANAYKKSDIGFLRYAGGNWNGGLAFDRQPMRDQGDFNYRGNSYYQNYGTDELAGLSAFANAAGADVMIEVNVFRDDPEMWADMVKYTNIENNYDFKYWEIGNENEATWNSTYLSPDEYMRRFIAYEKAMKAVDPSIVVIGPTNASPANASNGAGGLNRDITELPGKLKAANGRELGGISWHWYDGWQDNTIGNIFRYAGPDGSGLGGNNAWSRSWGDKVPAAIEQYAIKGAPILDVVSEINTLAENRNHIQQNHVAGLFLSDALPRLAANGVDMTALWLGYSEFGSAFGMVQHSGKGANMRLNSPYYVYYMLANYFGDQFIGSTPLTHEKISIWASRDSQDPGKIKLMISNLSDADIPATVSVTGFNPTSGVYYELLPDGTLPGLSGNGDVDVYSRLNGKKLDINNLDASIAAITPNNLVVTSNGFTRTFPKYSVTSVILSGSGTGLPTSIPSTASPSNTPISAPSVTTAPSGNKALLFDGTGKNYLDRVEIAVDNPAKSVDIGAGDFTIEWWMKANAAQNTSGTDSRWIAGAILFDRDILGNSQRDFGISMFKTGTNGVIRFGVGDTTIQGTKNVGDDVWHHIAVTRRVSDGRSCIFVDGQEDTCGVTRAGDVSYPDGQTFQTDYTASLPSATRNMNPFLVLAAEKHDYCNFSGCSASDYPAYKGTLDEIRISNSLRYTASFTKPSSAFTTDANTMALYHFDEGAGTTLTDGSAGSSNGVIKYTSGNAYPQWVSGFISAGGGNTPTSVPNPSGSPTSCPRHPEGDANCDGKVNLSDLEIWTREFLEDSQTTKADFYTANTCKARDGGTKSVCLDDLQIWTTTYLNGG